MNGHKNVGAGKSRTNRTLKLAPTTRAVRAALAASVTALALAGSGAAFAACSYTLPTTVTCTAGAYTNLPDGYFVPVADLTLVLDAGVIVTPGAGVIGVDANDPLWTGDVTVISSADITTVGADGIQAYGTNTASVSTYGDITTSATSNAHNALDISALNDVTVVNGGDIYAYASAAIVVTAVDLYSNDGTVSIDNQGTITAQSLTDAARGVVAYSYYGDVNINNSGTIVAEGGAGTYNTMGVWGRSVDGDVSITNSGSVEATSYLGDAHGVVAAPNVFGVGVMYGYASIDNSGSVTATAYDEAIGIFAINEYGSTVNNSGSVIASSTGAAGSADGILVWATGDGDITISNDGLVTADIASGAGDATGIHALASGNGNITITNSTAGFVTGSSSAGDAYGIKAYAFGNGYITISNDGALAANAGAYGDTYGIYAYAYGDGNITITNSATGTITATSLNGDAYGIYAYTNGNGDIAITNDGAVTATAAGLLSSNDAYGIYAYAYGNGDVTVTNSATGSVTASVGAGYGDAYGIYTYAFSGAITVVNAGTVTVSSFNGDSYGIYADAEGAGAITITNSGTIDVHATGDVLFAGYAYGVYANAFGDGGVTVNNSGTISATGDYASATGIYAWTDGAGNITITNNATGTVTATAGGSGDATGIYAYAYGDGDVIINNTGNVAASASTGDAYGISAYAYGDATVIITNDGTVTADVAGGTGEAWGIYAYAEFNAAIDVTNSVTGIITGTVADGTGAAWGMTAYSNGIGAITIINDGTMTGTTVLGTGQAFGVVGRAAGDGDITITNSGTIGAYAGGTLLGGGGPAIGVVATASGTGDVTVDNILGTVAAISAYGSATGVFADAAFGDVNLTNSGSISAAGYGSATGVEALTFGDSGDIGITLAAASVIDANSISGYAAGIDAHTFGYDGNVTIDNAGSISAASYSGAVGVAADTSGDSGDIGITLADTSVIDVTATAGVASGILVRTIGLDSNVTIDNAGTIAAVSDDGYATGVYAYAAFGDVNFTNSGDITATASGYDAVAVNLVSTTTTTLTNSGTITADIAVLTGDSADTIYNYGTINGAIITGGGDDILYNGVGGIWNAVGFSDFGAGDDAIYNSGTINMTDASIDLGIDPVGNVFINDGTITVSGDNVIDMGTGADLITPNPNPFYNNGLIDFQDGAPDDTLTIVGDFAGDGDINVDVSALDGSADFLYIDGNVVDGSVNTVNVELLGLPESSLTSDTIIKVSGSADSSNFVLGEVDYDPSNFLTLDFSLDNSTPGEYKLGIFVAGLTDPGTIAASIGPSVQFLLSTQIGTWRQRMLSINPDAKHGVSLWARVFQSQGAINPEPVIGNFGEAGNFDFDQKIYGAEAGVDFAISDQFFVGLLLAKTKGDQHLTGAGVGSSEIDGDTFGVYGTWVAPSGFYVDLSYRWMRFDARLNSVAGAVRSNGDAETLNLELGYAWTLQGGLTIEPAFQYTRTSVGSIDTLSGPLGDFASRGGASSRARLGATFRKTLAASAGSTVWTPYLSLSAVREFDGDNEFSVNDQFFGATSISGTSALVEGGLNAQIGKWSVFGSLSWQDGGAIDSFFGGQVGVRYTF